MWMSKLGPIAMLESCSIECCLREALVKTFAAMKRSKGRGMNYVRFLSNRTSNEVGNTSLQNVYH